MLRSILLVLVTSFGIQANAFFNFDIKTNVETFSKHAEAQAIGPLALPWIVGEKADYNIKMSILSGTMTMEVKSETDIGFWIHQNMELMGQKNLVEMLFNKESGEVLEIRVNGKKEDLPEEPADQEILEQDEKQVTVPAGTFDSVYIKVRSNGDESEMWINPIDVPIFGLLKQLAPSQLGQTTLELTGFEDL